MRLFKKCYGSRKAKALSVAVLAVLIAATAALAAWINASGSGNAMARGAQAQQVTLVINPSPGAANADPVGPNDAGKLSFTVVNPSGQALTIASVQKSGTATTPNPSCVIDTHVSVTAPPGFIGSTLPAGTSPELAINVTADATFPVCAANAELTIPITLTATGL